MNKNILFPLVLFVFSCFITNAQTYNGSLDTAACTSGRYIDYVFQQYTLDSVTYSTPYGLKMDIYQPAGDTLSKRPVIIMAHGGSFITADREADPTIVQLCANFALRGYVTVSIDYRLTSSIALVNDSSNFFDILAKVMGDTKAAIRFLRQDAATSNLYRIDTGKIFGLGDDAGAVDFLHLAYITSLNQCPADFQTAFNNNGGFDGNSGNPGYSSQIAAVVNLAGGLNIPSFISAGGLPSANFQGSADNVISYYCADDENGLVPDRLCGLHVLEGYYENYNINHISVTYPGQGHVPWDNDTSLFTSVDTITRDFLAQFVCSKTTAGHITASLGNNATICTGTPVTLSPAVTGGTAPYTYAWSSTGNNVLCNTCASTTATITQSTTFTVTVTDANHNTATASISYLPVSAGSLTITTGGPVAFCQGGSVRLTASSGFNSYVWSQGSTASSVSVAVAANYTVTATAANGCTATATQAVVVNSNPSVIISGAASICQGSSTTLNASGGTSYIWSTGATSAGITVNPSQSTTYNVTATNSSGCSASASQTVVISNTPAASISGVDIICAGNVTTLTASTGAGYAWNNGATTASITASPAQNTTYSVTVTTPGGCTGTATASQLITVNQLPVAGITGNTTICSGQSTTLTAAGAGGYVWSNNSTTASITISPEQTSTYTLTVTNGNNCSASASAQVTVSQSATASISGINIICQGSVTTLNATGGGAYLWNNGATTAAITASPAQNTTYTVTVTATGACSGTATASQTVSVNPTPQVTITGDTAVCPGNQATLQAHGGLSFAWSNNNTGSNITVTVQQPLAYSVTGTDANGCTGVASQLVDTVVFEPVYITGQNSIVAGTTDTLMAYGGMAYAWSTGQTSQALVVAPQQTAWYTVTVTGTGGCHEQTSYLVTVITGISSLPANAFNATVYPTPFTGSTNLFMELQWPIALDVNMFDITGRVIESRHLSANAGNNQLSIGSQAQPGVYLVAIESNGNLLRMLEVIKQ